MLKILLEKINFRFVTKKRLDKIIEFETFRLQKNLEIIDLKNLITEKQNAIRKLKEELEEIKSSREIVIDPYIGDPTIDPMNPEPSKAQERREYVAKVAGLHREILAPKIKQMISRLHSDLENVDNETKHDFILKAAVYVLKELILWGNAMESEHMSYITELTEDQKNEVIDQIKSKI